MRLKTAICYLLVVGCYLLPVISHAQCAMCRAVLETEEGTQKAEAVNDGIVYLMVFPYLLVGILAIVIYRVYNKKKKINNAN
ncbi:MAG: hypothetical protein PSV16_15445 [Flavobacterium sp.]|nr:hypothetical protein [Flavobacterium sp.]